MTELSIRTKAAFPKDDAVGSDVESVLDDTFAKRRQGKPIWEGKTTEWQHKSKPNVGWLPVQQRPDMEAFLCGNANSHNAAMDDYMQNVEDFGLAHSMDAGTSFARREMDLDAGSHNDWESASGSEVEIADDPASDYGWDSEILQDFKELSTSSDPMETVARILSKRTRQSGVQYLCVYEGSTTDDARWVPCGLLKSPTEKELARLFEETEALRIEQQEDNDNDTESGDSTEEEDKYDDEIIARVLQKQEELGLGSDDIVLYAGDDLFASPSPGAFSFDGARRLSAKRHPRSRGQRDPTFPSASAMADALSMDPYGGFDVMDIERPSLKYKKKGRRGQMPPELEDIDMNEQMQRSWEADRVKKRLRKVEREELRQQGLLGRKGKSPNLKVKYKGGVDMGDIAEEIREFLMGGMET